MSVARRDPGAASDGRQVRRRRVHHVSQLDMQPSLTAFLPQLGTEDPDSEVRARAALSSTLIASLRTAVGPRAGLGAGHGVAAGAGQTSENRAGDRPA